MKGLRNVRAKQRDIVFFMLGAAFVSVLVNFSPVNDAMQQAVRRTQVGTPVTNAESNRFTVHPSIQKLYDEIDNEDPQTKCARYGLDYKPRDTLRRIFFGSMIADESLDLLRIHATEVYGIYETVSFVESNLTHAGTKRPLRYTKGAPGRLFVEGGVFGPSTRVHVDFFFNDTLDFNTDVDPMLRERIQRWMIIDRWKISGMKPDDIGILSDADETWSRDFLRAAQVCDIPAFRPDQDCREPKLLAQTIIYESSPECIWRDRRWFHPDMIIGECIDGIGDPTDHLVPLREAGKQGLRNEGYGGDGPQDYDRMDKSTKKYPLWNGADFRETFGGQFVVWKGPVETARPAAYGSAFHFHNFFDDLETLRNKYFTYGHANPAAMQNPISMLSDDIDLVVRCVHGLPNPNATSGDRKRFRVGFEDILGPKPIFFQNETYRLIRHAAIRRMIAQDEKVHGSNYTVDEESEETYTVDEESEET